MAPSISLHIFSYFIFITSSVHGALLPRGVTLPKKIFYNPNQKFNCLDGSGTFPFHFVNDDFCDCDDGSDEPGTPACTNGFFQCLNHGHVPKTLPSSQINDGICDCCDTSDEYNSTADCFNNCKELGQGALLAAKRLQDRFLKGQELRNEYVNQGRERREEYKLQLEELYLKEQAVTKIKHDKQDEKELAETNENIFLSKEKEFKSAMQQKLAAEKQILLQLQQQEEIEGRKAFLELDIDKDGRLTITELKTFIRFDYDQDGIVSDNEAQFYMHKAQEITLDEFLRSGWRVMKPAFTFEEPEDPGSESSENAIDPNIENKIIENIQEEFASSYALHNLEKDNILKDAAMARKEYADADKLLRDVQTEIWQVKRTIDADFGTEDEFLVLENECYEFSDKTYLYKLCLFDKIIQVVKVNQDETIVGLWDKWSGPKENHYQQMRYSRGTSCWNGPNRSAEIVLQCGAENRILSVEESSPCTYKFEFETPALCKEMPQHIRKILQNEIEML